MCSEVDSASENEYQGFLLGKGGRCVWLTTYNLCSAETQEIRGLILPGTPWATSACRGRPLLYLVLLITVQEDNLRQYIG